LRDGDRQPAVEPRAAALLRWLRARHGAVPERDRHREHAGRRDPLGPGDVQRRRDGVGHQRRSDGDRGQAQARGHRPRRHGRLRRLRARLIPGARGDLPRRGHRGVGMEQTIFAGLSTLEPGDALFDNGAAFTDRNIRRIDRLLQLGTVTHVHDAHAPLPAPTVAPSVVANPTGGNIPSNTTVYFGLTAVDAYGGETNIGPLGSAATPSSFGAPTLAPTAVADYSAGNLPIAQYYYAVTLADGMGGETSIGPYASL